LISFVSFVFITLDTQIWILPFQGSSIPCYINILSWEKVNLPANPSQPVPMRGGMELTPPRSQDKNTRVFAVIANPEVLRIRGKNAKDQNVSLFI
jgi:hypothetical protein